MRNMGKKDQKEAPIIRLRRLIYLVICLWSSVPTSPLFKLFLWSSVRSVPLILSCGGFRGPEDL